MKQEIFDAKVGAIASGIMVAVVILALVGLEMGGLGALFLLGALACWFWVKWQHLKCLPRRDEHGRLGQ